MCTLWPNRKHNKNNVHNATRPSQKKGQAAQPSNALGEWEHVGTAKLGLDQLPCHYIRTTLTVDKQHALQPGKWWRASQVTDTHKHVFWHHYIDIKYTCQTFGSHGDRFGPTGHNGGSPSERFGCTRSFAARLWPAPLPQVKGHNGGTTTGKQQGDTAGEHQRGEIRKAVQMLFKRNVNRNNEIKLKCDLNIIEVWKVNLLPPRSESHETSPFNIQILFSRQVMRILKLVR